MLGLSEPGYIDIMKESGKIDRAQLHKEIGHVNSAPDIFGIHLNQGK